MFPRYLCKSELALFFFYNINEIFKGHLSISANVRYHRISQLFLSKFSAISHMRIKDSQLSVRLCQGKGTNDILSLNFRQQRSQQRGTLTKLRHGTPPPPPTPLAGLHQLTAVITYSWLTSCLLFLWFYRTSLLQAKLESICSTLYIENISILRNVFAFGLYFVSKGKARAR